MVHSSGDREYRAAYQPTASGPSAQATTDNRLSRNLFIAVTVLGLATYGCSFGPVAGGGDTGWYVRFASLAALCAAFGLLAKQKPLPLVTAVLATMGFLDAWSSVLTTTESGWALTAIVILNSLQTTAAVAALLLSPKDSTLTAASGYEAYVDYYNQAVRHYYSQQAQSASGQQAPPAGQGQAYAEMPAAAQRQRTTQPPHYSDYAELDFTGTTAPVAPQRDSRAPTASGPAGKPSSGLARGSVSQPSRDDEQSAWPP